MKKTTVTALFFLSALTSFSKKGFKVDVSIPSEPAESVVYLAHYYGKPLPTIFKVDSAKVDANHHISFQKTDSVLGGIYLVIYKKNSQVAEFILNNGDQFSMTVNNNNTTGKPDITFTNSPENTRYIAYNNEMGKLSATNQELMAKLASAKTKADTAVVQTGFTKLSETQREYRKHYIAQYPNTFLAEVFAALQSPEVPKGPHYLEDGKTVDSLFDYNYVKSHYWDHFNFKDDRLINTPIYDAKLNDYFNKWIYQIPDTISAAADKILAATKNSKELFHYTLRTLVSNALQSKIMGMDEVFVHLVENYYMKGDAYWLSEKDLKWYEDRAQKIKPNVLGNTAPDLNMQDIFTLKDKPLSEVKSKYTVLLVWDYDCPVCKKEVPKLDSAYNAALKQKGVTIYSIASGGDLDKIQDFVKNNKIEDWVNVADVNNNTNFKEKYDAYSTPKVYLLDENKKIIGKGLDHSNILDVIEFTEKKKKI